MSCQNKKCGVDDQFFRYRQAKVKRFRKLLEEYQEKNALVVVVEVRAASERANISLRGMIKLPPAANPGEG